MPEFRGLPRDILLSISALSGNAYRDVGGEELTAELDRRGFQPARSEYINLMHQYRTPAT